MDNKEKLKKFFELRDEIDAYNRAVGKIYFDMMCTAPEEGMEQAGNDMAIVGKHVFEISHSDEYINLLTELHQNSEGLDEIEKKSIEHFYKDYENEKNVTPEFSYERDNAFNKAYTKWLEAKNANDYSIFKPSFAEIIDFTRRSIDLRDTKKKTYYDTCLDDFEEGGSIEQLDEFFSRLKNRIVPLLKKIQTDGKKIRTDFLSRPCEISRQEKFSRFLMDTEGLRRSALVFTTTEHPFTDNFGPHDVRVTTHYYEDNFVSNIFTTLHEGGHAMFMQNEPAEFYEKHTADRMTSAMHECISRFYENIVGRSREFIHFLYPKFLEFGGETFSDVTEEELYEAVNTATPCLIRMESDELTYCLHIMIRYEIEKMFVNGEISVDEVPAVWKAKYKEYLGLDVPDDARGCLQDVHWSGSYGYFPSYALGNAYGAQILATMKKDFDVDAAIANGDLKKVGDWLIEKVFSHASLHTPDEWIKAITGESLNVDYFLDYLENKFSALYELNK